MDLTSFITSLATSFIIFVVLMVLFTWLSRLPGNKEVYYPNRLLKGMDPFEGGFAHRNPFAWIKEALTSTEQDIIDASGVDTAVYFVFLSTVLGILVFSGLLLLPVLLPVAYTDNDPKSVNATISNGTFNDLDKLSMGNVAEKSPRLWGFLIGIYWVSLVTYYFLWKAYKHVAELRAESLQSTEAKVEQFAVIVRDIPPPPEGQTRKEQVDLYFSSIYPETFYRSMVVTENTEVNKIHGELEVCRKKLVRAEAIFEQTKTRPTNKIGFLGLVGEKVYSIEYYSNKINELVPQLEASRKVTLREKQQAAAIVFFTSRVTAASAAQSLHATHLDLWTVTQAPEPSQVIWSNLNIVFFSRQVRQYVIYAIVALTILFYMIPIGFISAFTTLDNLKKLLPFLKPIIDKAEIKTVLEAYLPQIALIVFLALLPKLLLFFSKCEGIPTQNHIERAASGKYFYFSILNVFIGVTLGGTLFSTFKTIEKEPNQTVTILANSLPGNATFFLTFVALKFFVSYGLELSRIVPLIIFHLKKKYLCKTEADIKEAWDPSDLGYPTRVPGDMLILTIVFCYSIIAPLIVPFGVVYFGLGWLVLRNQALKVYVPSYESYGRMWPHIHTRILAALVLFQATIFGYFGTKKFVYTTIVIPVIILSFIFGYVCNMKFYKSFEYPALEVAAGKLKETPDMELIFRAYIPASLNSEKIHDEQFEDALSQVSRSTSFV